MNFSGFFREPIEKRGKLCYNYPIPQRKKAFDMKRFFAAVLAAAVCFGLSGCALFDGFQYIKAMDLYEEGAYEEAAALFTELEDYADSQAMNALCRQKLDYAEAEGLFAAGRFDAALAVYNSLALYEDSPIKAVACQYALGQGCMEAADYQGAYTWFSALGGYEDASEKTEQARWLWLWDQVAKTGPLEYRPDPEGSALLELSALEEGRLLLTYTAEGSLLGIPYTDRLDISFGPYGADASYEALCVSQAATTITVEAAGPLYTDSFLPGAPVAMELFRQTLTVTPPDGAEAPEPSVTEDAEQMLLIRGLFSAAQTAVQEHLEGLLAQTGVPVTSRDLGFVISE